MPTLTLWPWRSSAAVATRQEGHRSSRSGPTARARPGRCQAGGTTQVKLPSGFSVIDWTAGRNPSQRPQASVSILLCQWLRECHFLDNQCRAQPLQPDERGHRSASTGVRPPQRRSSSSRARAAARRARQAQSKADHDLPGDRDASLNTPPRVSRSRGSFRTSPMRFSAYWAGRGIIGQPGRLELILLVPPAVES
jgi:hypothetical protein